MDGASNPSIYMGISLQFATKLDAPDLVFIQPQLQNDAVNLGLATKVKGGCFPELLSRLIILMLYTSARLGNPLKQS